MKKFSLGDVISVVIACVGFCIFGAMFVGCYVWALYNFSLTALLSAFLLSIIPGLIAYGIGAATIEFVRGESYSPRIIRRNRKKSYRKQSDNKVVSLVISVIAILLFGGMVIAAFIWAFMNFSFASILSAILISIIPACACYGCIGATVDFIKNDMN